MQIRSKIEIVVVVGECVECACVRVCMSERLCVCKPVRVWIIKQQLNSRKKKKKCEKSQPHTPITNKAKK